MYTDEIEFFTSNCKRGGGVLVGVEKDVPYQLVTVNDLNIEQLFVSFSFNIILNLKLVMFILNFPPNYNPSTYEIYTSNNNVVVWSFIFPCICILIFSLLLS